MGWHAMGWHFRGWACTHEIVIGHKSSVEREKRVGEAALAGELRCDGEVDIGIVPETKVQG